jgi:anti-sigma regulatory factor (Ser/Thr protein kinase)
VTDRLHLALDADPHLLSVLRHAVQNWLTAMKWPELAAEELVFAISETVSNSVEHAYRDLRAGRVIVEMTECVQPRAMHIVVTDFGRWRPHLPDPTRGNGLALMNAIVAWSRIETDDNGTRVTMRSVPLA